MRGTIPAELQDIVNDLLKVKPRIFDWKAYFRRMLGSIYDINLKKIDNIYYSYTPKSNREWMMVMFDNGSSIRIDDFESFHNTVLSETKESSEEILNNILDLLNE